ncbi:DegT/DnrJ/EryC1/StrS family aminotransferase [Listeria fleischmannii]|uniref:Aminotransferase DegT n=1 Tax=Listeria fleischmannii TaxID=1069827 RepID=A0A841YBI8_9LIST|nr:DegT/DnrJ/EryC1/StrS family aminotransferase [Listeria fleischmannii]EIA20378.1 DegT/DnrJ/EryC1/StrS aminotransferase [Listeria fleischmannii subsp. coloradonensis]MBC1397635.1 aminotransferase DegT [Listeria fleischmannii]MBC1426824.1 aminotransferase DegT [Listeria fleischmannii]STY33717.1 UDP-4-amino-4-deoxy-L-arabinose--oxoglutarate aminotransferase [Listeria fleischmannii subsp. coloradonensis]
MNKQILLSPPDMSGQELEYIKETFRDNWIAPVGPNIDAFEEELADYVGVEYSVAVSSGTAGLHLALIAAGVGAGDVVFCQSFTFAASVNPILYQKAIPVLIDSEETSWNMSAELLEEALKKEKVKPKAVIVTHIYGQIAELKRIKQLCENYEVILIEDACESLGSVYHSQHTGTIGDIGVYSFNGNKIITTSGGGMVVTNNVFFAEKIRYLSTQAKSKAPFYLHEEIGYNYRLSNVLAGIGRGQLLSLDKKIEKRREIYSRYSDAFEEANIYLMPEECPGTKVNRWLSVILLPVGRPVQLMNFMKDRLIESRLTWNPMHRQPFLKNYSFYKTNKVAVSDRLFLTGLCLPSGSSLSQTEQEKVINTIKEFLIEENDL